MTTPEREATRWRPGRKRRRRRRTYHTRQLGIDHFPYRPGEAASPPQQHHMWRVAGDVTTASAWKRV
jgi:hypothetical protein